MNSQRKRYLILTLIVLLVAAVFIYNKQAPPIDAPDNEGTAVLIENGTPVTAEEIAAPVPPSPTPSPSATPEAEEPEVDLNIREVLNECFEGSSDFAALQGATDLNSLVAGLEQNRPVSDEKELENYRYKLPDQTEKRLQLIYEPDGQEGKTPRVTLRVFAMNAKGFPEPVAVNESDRENPSEDVIQKYLSEGQVHFHQVRRTLMLPNGNSAQIDTVNGQTREVMIQTLDRSFVCGDTGCRCVY